MFKPGRTLLTFFQLTRPEFSFSSTYYLRISSSASVQIWHFVFGNPFYKFINLVLQLIILLSGNTYSIPSQFTFPVCKFLLFSAYSFSFPTSSSVQYYIYLTFLNYNCINLFLQEVMPWIPFHSDQSTP